MRGNANLDSLHPVCRRRGALLSVALAVGSLAAGGRAFAEDGAPKGKEAPGPLPVQLRTSLHEEVRFKASPQRVYEALISSQQFTAFSGAPATIDSKVGGAFSMFDGRIVGLNIELVPNQRLVQAWRPANWEPGLYSLVRFELKPEGKETLVILDHSGFPVGDYEHLSAGWRAHYWQPLTKYFASGAAAPK